MVGSTGSAPPTPPASTPSCFQNRGYPVSCFAPSHWDLCPCCLVKGPFLGGQHAQGSLQSGEHWWSRQRQGLGHGQGCLLARNSPTDVGPGDGGRHTCGSESPQEGLQSWSWSTWPDLPLAGRLAAVWTWPGSWTLGAWPGASHCRSEPAPCPDLLSSPTGLLLLQCLCLFPFGAGDLPHYVQLWALE